MCISVKFRLKILGGPGEKLLPFEFMLEQR